MEHQQTFLGAIFIGLIVGAMLILFRYRLIRGRKT
jgi:hypothetical protein